MADLLGASLQELVDELQSRGKASLIAVVPKTKQDADNPDDGVELFTDGNLADKGWLLTALQTIVTEEVRKDWTPDEEDEDA